VKAKLILCEGKDDQAVIEGLLAHLQIGDRFTVEQIEGRNLLKAYLRALPARPEFVRQEVEALGIVLDANGDPTANWRRIVDSVNEVFKVKLSEPAKKEGTLPTITGMLIPAGGQPGMLETVCLESVKGALEYACFETYVQCIEKTAGRQLHPKAKFRAWIASQPDFEFLIEKAARGNLFPWNHSVFGPLREFLAAL
jgi:hypothetical protein